jgi:hypothetical protein
MGSGINSWVYALTSFDPDGDGPLPPSVVAAGSISQNESNGTIVRGVARWDGTEWRHVGAAAANPGTGTNGYARAAVQFDDDGPGPRTPSLFVGGNLSLAGWHSSAKIARFGPVADTLFATQPSDASAYTGAQASFAVTVSGATPRTYQWLRNGSALSDGAQPGGSVVSGAATDTLSIAGVSPQDAGAYSVVVSDSCGAATSRGAALGVVPRCSADFDADGDVATDADIEAFFACLAGRCCLACGSADFDGDGDSGTDADIESFFRAIAGHGC